MPLRSPAVWGLLLLVVACEDERPSASTVQPTRTATAAPPKPAAEAAPLSRGEFARIVQEGSEKNEYFFSDNLISNETGYQKPAPLLTQLVEPGGAYIGVGPEQNFTYIALVQPKLAVIVDIRRDNLLQLLLYKALFELAETRTEFLCLLLGREWSEDDDPGPSATLAPVLEATRRANKSQAAYDHATAHIGGILDDTGIELDAKDRNSIERMRRAFFEKQLELRFELHQATSHSYPTLEAILSETDSQGKQRGFLATEAAFRVVQSLQRQNRVIPLVGDFAGPKALRTVAAELTRNKLTVSLFYVSNVEQYLFEGDAWQRWVTNLEALPTNEKSLVARVHLDQGRAHPLQLEGHRSTTVLQRFAQFFEHQERRPYRSAWELVTEDLVVVDVSD